MAKPTVVVVGADKGGVGKTTVARTLLDYFTVHHVPTRAFDTESPKGTLKRFHPDISDIVDVTSVPDQMRIFDTLSTTDASVTVIDVRAGLLSPTLRSLRDIGFLEAVKKGQLNFAVFHILGSSIASLNEIEDTSAFTTDAKYSWSRTTSTIRASSNGTSRRIRPISRGSRTPSRSPSRNSTRWPTSRSSSLRCRSSPSSPTRIRRAMPPTIRSCCAAMSGTGSAMSGANTIASSSTTSSPAPALARRRGRRPARAGGPHRAVSGLFPHLRAGEMIQAGVRIVATGPGMPQQAPLYIVASPRPRVGKTLIARLLIEFFRDNGRALVGYDLDPREPTLAGYFPTSSRP